MINSGSMSLSLRYLFIGVILFFISSCSYDVWYLDRNAPENLEKTIEFMSTRFTAEASLLLSTPMSLKNTDTPAPLPKFTSTPTATDIVCNQPHGKMEFRELLPAQSSNPFAFRIYLPPCYDFNLEETYPVLYLLHGQSFKDDQWDRLGVDEIADRLIVSGEISPLIIAMPWEVDNLQDDKVSKFGDLLIDEFIPWVDAEYRTCIERECRAIGGISRGAAWAMRLGFTQWELFGAIGAHSFAPFPGDFYNVPIWLKEIPAGELPRIYMDMGYLDFMLQPAGLFEDRLTDYAVPHEWIINEGTHNDAYWGAHVEDYLYWYTFSWKR